MNSKKKICIVSHSLRIDGVNRSLIGLLDSFDYTRYEVDLFLLLHEGEYLQYIPEQVNLLPENKKYSSIMIPAARVLQYGFLDILYTKWKVRKQADAFWKKEACKGQNTVYPLYLHKAMMKKLPPVSDKEYDLCLSFLPPHYIAAQKVRSKVRVGWIHNDYSVFDFDKKNEVEMWKACDYIASISDDSSRSFIQSFPELSDRIIKIENILNPKTIRQQAAAFSVENEMVRKAGEFIICSVGRYMYQKNFDNVPAIAAELRKLGIRFKWYLIGFGNDKDIIHQKIKENKVEDCVIDLGLKENPYPFVAACDLYAQPSRFEGKSVSVREAQILGKPVLITAFPTSASQLEDGLDGLIVPLDNAACAKGIADLLENNRLLDELSENCKNRNYGNEEEIEKIYRLIDES